MSGRGPVSPGVGIASRVAVVTGAARGIGAATVQALAADGWSVVALDRCADDPRLPYPLGRKEALSAVVDAARALPGGAGRVAGLAGDASCHEDIAEAVEVAEREFGGLDAMVAVAGVVAGGRPLWEVPLDQEEAVLDGNLRAALAAARVAVPALLRRSQPRAGRFIAVSSAAAVRGMPKLAAYCAAKAGIEGFVRALAAELRGSGVTANCVSPGSTATEILDESARLYGLESSESFSRQQPIERLIRPEEVASALAWLAGLDTGGITGATIAVDGGLTV